MLPPLRECAPTFGPHLADLATGAAPLEADAAEQVAAEYVRVFPKPKRRDGHVMGGDWHPLVSVLPPPRRSR